MQIYVNAHLFGKQGMNKVLIGNLSLESTEVAIKELFSRAGRVQAVALKKGFAFVQMSSPEEADKAVETLCGADLDGRSIIVNYSQPIRQKRTNGWSRISRYMRFWRG